MNIANIVLLLSGYCFLLLGGHPAQARYPHYLPVNEESGLPSNEVYSMACDKKGFLWFGCDAGLYKYDGIRFTAYKCPTQKSKSITGLFFSSSGKLYCRNFQSQIFYLENDSLKELPHPFSNIPNLCTDTSGNIFINHAAGVSGYNEKSRQWKTWNNFGSETPYGNALFTKSVRAAKNNHVYFISTSGIGHLVQGKLTMHPSDYFSKHPPGNFLLECLKNEVWIFSAEQGMVFRLTNGNMVPVTHEPLRQALQNRKITSVNALPDGHLWICTYKGIIRFNPASGALQVLYPHLAFSDCLIDREGNYWLATLQAGLMRVPDLNFLVWNTGNGLLKSDQLTSLAGDSASIYFSTINGTVGRLNIYTHELNLYHTGNDADIQSLDYDVATRQLYFYISGNLYSLQNGIITRLQSGLFPVKSVLTSGDSYLLASSFGTFAYTFGKKPAHYSIHPGWSRQLISESTRQRVWAATNDGLLCAVYKNNQWTADTLLFPQTQILSAGRNELTGEVYALTFDGKVYVVNKNKTARLAGILPPDIQAYKLRYQDGKLYVCTNRGLWITDIMQHTWTTLNKYSGLASDHILDVRVTNGNIWLATARGLQKVPLVQKRNQALATVHLKQVMAGNTPIHQLTDIQLTYRQPLRLQPEASLYSSNGNFRYAYRITSADSNWSFLPANIERIEIPHLPSRNFVIELKVVDHLGRDSENTIRLTGYVHPPFWETGWFYVLVILVLSGMVWMLYKRKIKLLRKKQSDEIERLNLEHELRLAQQSALKAQMNPHFIFNVLNSIKGYIYKNDKQKASAYLSDFSDLMRTILDMSHVQYVRLADELRMLNLYIELEAMMLPDGFTFTLDAAEATTDVEIPALLIQPYIENAFKHGLRHREGKKQLQVKVYMQSPLQVCISIRDNGIGRAAASALQAQVLKHRSFATTAIEKRISLINREGKQQVTTETTDLFDASGMAAGTQVTLTITQK